MDPASSRGNKYPVAFVLLLKAYTAKAEQLITCRLAAYEKANGEWVCLYKGANNTQDVHLDATTDCHNETTCKYDPKNKPVNIRNVLNANKEAMDQWLLGKQKSGQALKRWFKEDWKDVRTGKAWASQG